MSNVEGLLVEEEPVKRTAEDFDEYEQAAIMFNTLSKQFRKMGYALAARKKKAAIRVLEAFLFEPLEDVKLEGKAEKELLDIAKQIMHYKIKINEYAITRSQELKKESDNE